MNIQVFTFGGLRVNNYLVWEEVSKQAFLVDASEGIEEIQVFIESKELILEFLFLTHSHFDHISGLKTLFQFYPDLIMYMHKSERLFLSDMQENLSIYTDSPFSVDLVKEPFYLEEGDKLLALDQDWKVWHIPGHSPGSLGLISDNELIGFTGDVIFSGGRVGRYDLPYSKETEVRNSAKRLCSLLGDYKFYPGHGTPLLARKERVFH